MRVQIPPYTDRWMMGDRYGEVVKVTKSRRRVIAKLGEPGVVVRDIAHVRLDKSGKTVRVFLADCTEV